MKVVILCGGLGTRLREETEYRPKPMVEIGGKPILWHIMKIYAAYGYNEFILCLGYRGQIIKEYFLNYEAFNNNFTMCLGGKSEIVFHDHHREQDFKVTLIDTGIDAMTGSRVKQIERHIDTETFMVTYGDGLADIDIAKLVEFHHSHQKLATVTAVRPISRFGILEENGQSEVTGFKEKPQLETRTSAGFFVFDRRVFDYLSTDKSCVLEQEPLSILADIGQMMAYHHEGSFFTMDTYREYLQLNELWEQNKAPWKIWDTAYDKPILV